MPLDHRNGGKEECTIRFCDQGPIKKRFLSLYMRSIFILHLKIKSDKGLETVFNGAHVINGERMTSTHNV